MFPWIVTGAALVAWVGLAAWCWTDASRRLPAEASRWWQGGLVLAVGLLPVLPGPTIPVRVERAVYEGPDLLSDIPTRTLAAGSDWTLRGVVRKRTLREVQGNTLLEERTRVEVALPWLLLLVAAGWTLGRRRGRVGRAGVVVGAVFLAGGCAPEGTARPEAELRLIELMEIRRTGDATGIESVFHPTAVYEDLTSGVTYRGLPEIAGYMEGFHDPAGAAFLEVVRYHAGEGMAAAEWILDGVRRPVNALPEDLDAVRRFRMDGVTVVEVEGGLVVRAADYGDPTSLIVAEGGMVVLPDGDTLAPTPGSATGPPPRP